MMMMEGRMRWITRMRKAGRSGDHMQHECASLRGNRKRCGELIDYDAASKVCDQRSASRE